MKTKILTFLFITLGIFLRLYQLGSLPNSYTPDELAQGYTAYSILNTGHDEWGSANLFNLQSFGDYKAPFQTWLMIPSIKLFGLNSFAIRLPNAIFSSLALIFTVLLSYRLFSNLKISLIVSILTSFSPLMLPISRIALEANFTIFFTVLSLFIILKPKLNLLNYLIFTFSLILNLLTYHSAKLISPIFFLSTIIFIYYYQNKSLKTLKSFLPYLILFFIFTYFIIIQSLQGSSRVGDISIFNPTDNWKGLSNDRYLLVQNGLPDFISRVIHNKLLYVLNAFSASFISYFSPQYLLTTGAGETTYGMLTGFGILGIIGFIGLISSIYFYKKAPSKLLFFIWFLILISAIPAALAKGTYPGNRLSNQAPYLIILSSFGLYYLTSLLNKLAKSIFYFFLVFTQLPFILIYFFGANQILSQGMLYGRQQAIEYVSSKNITNKKVLMSRKLSEPQTYVMFFTKIDPIEVQQASKDWQRYKLEGHSFLDQLGEYHLNNYTFKDIVPSDFSQYGFVIGKPDEFFDYKPNYIIFYPNSDKPAVYIYYNDQK